MALYKITNIGNSPAYFNNPDDLGDDAYLRPQETKTINWMSSSNLTAGQTWTITTLANGSALPSVGLLMVRHGSGSGSSALFFFSRIGNGTAVVTKIGEQLDTDGTSKITATASSADVVLSCDRAGVLFAMFVGT